MADRRPPLEGWSELDYPNALTSLQALVVPWHPRLGHTCFVPSRDEVVRRYEAYLDTCNRRAWDELGTFIADHVLVNGSKRSRHEYVADLVATISAFPDYRWELRRAVLDGEWLAVHLHDTGTRLGDILGASGDGARVETDEFDMYHIVDGVIVEVEGTADNARLCQ